jgi:thioredoxin-dependent peroxiredoxin
MRITCVIVCPAILLSAWSKNMNRMILAILVSIVSTLSYCADAPAAAKVGDPTPDITAMDDEGEEVKLSSYKDKNGLVLFFFPKANTPGCTKETCGFRDDAKAFSEKGYVVFGISRDTREVLAGFKKTYGVAYSFLSDPDGKLAAALGIPAGTRQTAIIGKDGKITKIYQKVDAATHSKDVLKDLAEEKK